MLNYTYESIVEDFNATKCVELGENVVKAIDGATTEEAGGFLAWTNAQVDDPDNPGQKMTYPTGSINSRREDNDKTDTGVVDDRWTPPAEGDYIFRRKIDTSDMTAVDDYNSVKYTYAGYHFVPGNGKPKDDPDYVPDKYYKIIIGTDKYPTVSLDGDGKYVYDISAESSALGTVTIDKDGVITDEDVTIRYVVLNEVVNQAPTLTYGDTEDVNGDGAMDKYLIASYTDDKGVNAEISARQAELTTAQTELAAAQETLESASANRAKKEVDYQDALGAYNSALSRYTQAKADYDYAKALADATNALIKAANDRAAAEATKDTDAQELQTAATDLKTEASGLLTSNPWIGTIAGITGTPLQDSTSAIGNYTLIPQETRTHISNYNTQFNNKLSNVTANLADFDASYTKIQGYIANIKSNLDSLAAIKNDVRPDTKTVFEQYATAEAVETYTKAVEDNYAKLAAELQTYARLYTDIKEATVAEDNLTGLDYATGNPVSDFITGDFAALSLTDLRSKTDTYKDEWSDCNDQFKDNGVLAEAQATWENDVKAYNKAVSDAKTTYDDVIDDPQGNPNNNANKILKNDETTALDTMDNNGKTLVPYNGTDKTAGYSASFDGTGKDGTGDGSDPTIAENVSWKVYTTEDAYSSKPLGTDKKGATDPNADTNTKIITQTYEAETAFTELTPRDILAGTATAKPLGELSVDDDGKITAATDNTLAAELKSAYEALKGTDSTDGAEKEYEAAKKAYDDANTAIANANATIADAEAAIAALTDKSDIKIYIVLDKDVTTNWTRDDAEDHKSVDFYLNKILEAGETSEKLIDYVKLDSNVNSLDYKNLVFDLNVGLDSVQVTYDENQRDYTATAVNVDDNNFDLVATVGDDNSKVTWATKTAATTPTYKVRGTTVTPTDLTENNEISGTEYKYQITTTYGTFWGTELKDGAEFVKVDLTTPATPALATGDGTLTVTLNVE